MDNLSDLDKLNKLEPIQISHQVTIDFNSKGKLSFRLIADRMERYVVQDTSYTEFFGNIFLEGFNDEGESETKMYAQYGLYLQNSYLMIAKEDVELINVNNEKLNTEELTWNQRKHRIYTDKPVTIVQEDGIIHGIGLDADESFIDYQIKQITGTFSVEEVLVPEETEEEN